jgi:hypothetical protein
MKILPFEAELFYGDGRTNGQTERHDEANSPFRNFANAPKNTKHESRPPTYKIAALSMFKVLTSRQPF